jgi:hypothetical protein
MLVDPPGLIQLLVLGFIELVRVLSKAVLDLDRIFGLSNQSVD